MKKLMFLFVLFCGVFTLSAAELSFNGWKNHVGQGKFTFKNDKYPMMMSCQTATADKAGKLGVWGRFYRKETVQAGKKYEIKVVFKMTNSKNGLLAVWVRDGGMFNLFGSATAEPQTLSKVFTASKETVVIYLNLMKGTADVEIISVELNPVE